MKYPRYLQLKNDPFMLDWTNGGQVQHHGLASRARENGMNIGFAVPNHYLDRLYALEEPARSPVWSVDLKWHITEQSFSTK
jgi:hypothetical protein